MTTSDPAWLLALHQRGLLPTARAALDWIEPFAALGAQVLYVAQPAAGILGGDWRQGCGDLARALESPAALADLRTRCDTLLAAAPTDAEPP